MVHLMVAFFTGWGGVNSGYSSVCCITYKGTFMETKQIQFGPVHYSCVQQNTIQMLKIDCPSVCMRAYILNKEM